MGCQKCWTVSLYSTSKYSKNHKGILRIDGTFEKSHLEEEKGQAASQLMESRCIKSKLYNHVFDRANLMNR